MFVLAPQGSASELHMEFLLLPAYKLWFNSAQLAAASGCELLIDDVGLEFLHHSLWANWVIIYQHHLIIMAIH